jgi:Tfp pilus assembly protein PilF
LLLVALFLLPAGDAVAQATSTPSRTAVTVRGQVYAPGGGPLQQQVRVFLSGDDMSRPNENFYTDSNGRFLLSGLSGTTTYTFTVESDGENWDTTVERFIPTGFRSVVNIYLRPLVKKTAVTQPTVSVGQMQQNVPRNARRQYDSAVNHIGRSEDGLARAQLERAIQLYPNYIAARNELAVLLMREGKLAEAETLLRRALELDPAAVHPLLNLGLCLYRQERYEDALPYLEKATQLLPTHAKGQMLLGIVLVMSGDDRRAEPVLVRAYELDPARTAKTQFYLARLYVRWRDYARAATALENYLRDVPNDPNAENLRITLARLYAARRP